VKHLQKNRLARKKRETFENLIPKWAPGHRRPTKIKKLPFLKKELCLGKTARQNLKTPPLPGPTVLGLVFAQKRGTFVQNIKFDSETLVFL
jgi:hypothetical protein